MEVPQLSPVVTGPPSALRHTRRQAPPSALRHTHRIIRAAERYRVRAADRYHARASRTAKNAITHACYCAADPLLSNYPVYKSARRPESDIPHSLRISIHSK